MGMTCNLGLLEGGGKWDSENQSGGWEGQENMEPLGSDSL